ncbi:hypothetical protein ACFL4T_04405 [candidate division KSB1 bacterium]
MRRYKLIIYSVCLLLIFFNSCKKDWNNIKPDIYQEVECPPEASDYDPNIYDVTISVEPDTMIVGTTEVEISVEVTRNDLYPINFDIFYDWTVNNGVSYQLAVIENILSPRINGSINVNGFGLTSITATTFFNDRIVNYLQEDKSTILQGIGFINITLRLGYTNDQGEISFFFSTGIPVKISP